MLPPIAGFGPEPCQRVGPLRRIRGHDERSLRRVRQSGRRARRAHDGLAEGRRFEQLVLDAAARNERQHDHGPPADGVAQVRQISLQFDAWNVRERAHRCPRFESDNREARVRRARPNGRPDLLTKPAQALDVGLEIESAPEYRALRLLRHVEWLVVIRVHAVGDDVHVGDAGEPSHRPLLGGRHDPRAVHERRVDALVETLDAGRFEVAHPGRTIAPLHQRQVMPDPLVGGVPDTHDLARYGRQVGERIQSDHHRGLRTVIGHDGVQPRHMRLVDPPVRTIALL